jgi:hypothetical protein
LDKPQDRNIKESGSNEKGTDLRIRKPKLFTFGAILEGNFVSCDKMLCSFG